MTITRRAFVAASAAALATPLRAADPSFRTRSDPAPITGRKPIAVICTVYRPMSHAYHIAGRFLHGYQLRGDHHVPAWYVKSMYVDQKPDNDLSVELSKEFGFRLSSTIVDALLENGKLAVDGVLIIGEHGQYPHNAKGQELYPRAEFFAQTVEAFRKSNRVVPVFNDKHLSYSWDKAKAMVETARQMKFGFMAGSSLPVTWRRPELELPLETPIEEGLVVTYGETERYGIHGLETLQVMLERRKGGETGVKAVTALTGDAVWQAGEAGQWSWALLEAALAKSETVNIGGLKRTAGKMAVSTFTPLRSLRAILVEYRDGTKGTVLFLDGAVQDFTFAARIAGRTKPAACLFHLPPPPGARYFDALTYNIESLYRTGTPPYPIERTLLTTGVLDFAMTAMQTPGTRVETPPLTVRYSAPKDSGFFRGEVAR